MQSDEGVTKSGPEIGTAGRDCFGAPADLKHARRPGIGRHEVVDDDRSPGVGLDVAVFLCRGDVVPADVDGAEIGVVAKRRWYDVGLAVGSGGCDPSEPLA